MIKTDKVDVLLGRMDTLIALMEKSVKAPRKEGTNEAEPVRAYKKKTKVMRRKYKPFPPAVYESVSQLTIGEKANITVLVRESGVPLPLVNSRVNNWAYIQRKEGKDKSFRVFKQGWDFYVERTR